VLVAGESEYLDIPSDFTITNAEIVADQAGSVSVAVYAASYASWDPSGARWTLISASDPLVLSGSDKATSFMTGWTKTFTGGHYLKFVITGTPSAVTKATATLTLSAPVSVDPGSPPNGPAGGDLQGTYPDPTIIPNVALAGNPTTTTQSPGNNTTRIATTAFVADAAATINAALALKANLASPALTGTPTAPTAAVGTNTTQLATTAFVLANAGGSGPGTILASYWSNATLTINPDTSADTIITGMSATFTVSGSTDVAIRADFRGSKNAGYIVLSVYESGVKLAPLSGAGAAPPPAGWYLPGQVNSGERQNQQGSLGMGYTFAAGTHTIDIYHAASGNLNAVTFYERLLTITKL